jgi:hypothetical protein
VGEISNADCLKAITSGSFEYGLNRASERFADFFGFLKKMEAHLQSQGITIAWPEAEEIPNSLVINTRLGAIELTTIQVLDDSYIGAALLFTDREAKSQFDSVRKLYAVGLRADGQWFGSDGESLGGDYGQLTPLSAFKAVSAAVAAKLKANTEYFQSFQSI